MPIEFDDAANTEERSVMEFALGGLPSGQILVDVSLVLTPSSGVGDSVFQYHGFVGDGFVGLFDAYEDRNLLGRLTDYNINTPQPQQLDPGFLSTLIGVESHLGIYVRQETDLATGGFRGKFTAFPPELELTFVDPLAPTSNHWVTTGNSSWNATSHWSLGIPISSDDIFIQPTSPDVIQGPPNFEIVNTLTLGGGGAQATLAVAPNQQFQSNGLTTLFSDAVLQLNGGTYRTGGLNNAAGGIIDWGTDGVLAIESGYLSTPPGDFIVDGANKPLLLMTGGKLVKVTDASDSVIIGDTQGGFLLVAFDSEVRTRGMKIGNQLSGDGQLQVDGQDALLVVSALLEVGPTGRGDARIENGARFEGGGVLVGSTPSGVYDPTTFASMTITDPATTAKLAGLGANGRSLVEIANGAVVETRSAGGSGDPNDPPILRVTGAGSRLTILDRLQTGSSVIENGSFQVVVEDGGRLDTNLVLLSLGSALVGTARTEMTITGVGSEVNVSDSLILGTFNDAEATLEVLSGGVLRVTGQSILSAALNTVAIVRVSGTGSRWEQTGELSVGGGRGTNGILLDLGEAAFSLQDGATLAVNDAVNIMALGTFNMEGGSLSAPLFRHDRGGDFSFTGGTLSVDQFIGDLANNGGIVSPGQSAGITVVDGFFDQNLGTLEIEIFGGGVSPVPGADFDQLLADTADLAGALSVVLDPNYAPAVGDVFMILQTTNGISGVFDTTTDDLPDLGLDLQWALNYMADNVVLEVTPISAVPGDYDGNGEVDGFDFLKWQRGESPMPLSSADLADWEANYGTSTVPIQPGDFDGNGNVDGLDFLKWQRGESPNPLSAADLAAWEANYGTVAPLSTTLAAVPVPEPSTSIVLLFGMLALLFRRDGVA